MIEHPGARAGLAFAAVLAALTSLGEGRGQAQEPAWPFAPVISVAEVFERAAPAVELRVPGKEPARLADGDPLIIQVDLPEDPKYLYLTYVQKDGYLGHLANLPVKGESDGPLQYNTGFEISPPFGREMILGITSPEPLFTTAQPANDDVDTFVSKLRQRLVGLAVEGHGRAISIGYLFVETHPD